MTEARAFPSHQRKEQTRESVHGEWLYVNKAEESQSPLLSSQHSQISTVRSTGCPAVKPSETQGSHSSPWSATSPPLGFWPSDSKSQHTGKDPDAGKDWRQEERGTTEDEMVRWHHRLNGHESEQTQGDRRRQGGLACCSPWGCKDSDTTEQLNKSPGTGF